MNEAVHRCVKCDMFAWRDPGVTQRCGNPTSGSECEGIMEAFKDFQCTKCNVFHSGEGTCMREDKKGIPCEGVIVRVPVFDLDPQHRDSVNHPSHYNAGKIEVIEFLEDQFMNRPHEWNAVKYICRAGKKDPAKEVEDLEKAIWYLRRKIVLLKGEETRPNDMPQERA